MENSLNYHLTARWKVRNKLKFFPGSQTSHGWWDLKKRTVNFNIQHMGSSLWLPLGIDTCKIFHQEISQITYKCLAHRASHDWLDL